MYSLDWQIKRICIYPAAKFIIVHVYVQTRNIIKDMIRH